ncbi:poly(A) RNA polymerase gld-2 homolog A [Trichonephila inaurata madagascariensis]|uniref:Poly(A) RNA polymerase gld-2 homolog A n=1 Tax=Trichonephila inaurata madagascariensis TaxID=2747483 RepID=A0A8X6XM61_9ARAC|nr:poly(A) RNA polymerase gld-2 homolog A [Trichonephila inaurata madagascariensis]
MYHNLYHPPWFVTNQAGKTPFLLTYGDLSLISIDHLTAFMPTPLQQHPVFATSQIALDIPNVKRVPMSMLMQSMESVNNYMPFLRRRNFNPILDRQYSKESLVDSAGGDSGVSSSRSSTPSSVETSGSSESKNVGNVNTNGLLSNQLRPRRRIDHGNSSQRQNIHRRFQSQKRSPQNSSKVPNGNIPSRKIPQHPKDEWFNVSQGIWEHYIKTRQKEEMYIKKMNLRTAVHSLLSQIFPNCGLRVVGSSVNGLGTNSSDVDMCLVLASPVEIDQQTEAMHLLQCAQKLLNQCSFVKSTDLITAKVPILKFIEKYNSIQVDLNINNTVGIANTQLLGTYSQLDWRVPPLVLVIKKWAQDCKINNAKEMTLSSYSLVLMVIHYLQCGCDPPVLPCLQKMQSRRCDSGDYWKCLIPYGEGCTFRSKNTQSLGSLLFGFFDYYSDKFDFSKDVISVRLGCKLQKQVAMNFRSTKNKRGHWKFICIEEPFNRTNTACAVYDQASFNRIMSAFKTTWLHLKEKKELASVLSLQARTYEICAKKGF